MLILRYCSLNVKCEDLTLFFLYSVGAVPLKNVRQMTVKSVSVVLWPLH